MIDAAYGVWQNFYYGVLGKRPSIDLTTIPQTLQFKNYYDKKNKVFWIEAVDLPGFLVSGKTQDELARNFHETMMVYFDVPTYFAKKLNPIISLDAINPKTKQPEQTTVNYRKELHKVLA